MGALHLLILQIDSVLGPRETPHAWAFAGDTPGKLLIALAPANKMEEFFRSFKPRAGAYSNSNDLQDKERMRAYSLELLGTAAGPGMKGKSNGLGPSAWGYSKWLSRIEQFQPDSRRTRRALRKLITALDYRR